MRLHVYQTNGAARDFERNCRHLERIEAKGRRTLVTFRSATAHAEKAKHRCDAASLSTSKVSSAADNSALSYSAETYTCLVYVRLTAALLKITSVQYPQDTIALVKMKRLRKLHNHSLLIFSQSEHTEDIKCVNCIVSCARVFPL